jgi:hypothetical protein
VSCFDVDECSLGVCHADASCTNSVGSFTCVCDPGFAGTGITCTDIDECTTAADDCDVHATCTNTAGSFSCACTTGYAGDGRTCTDVDECTAMTDNCHLRATCANTEGGFTCACIAGYAGTGVTCTDIDECVLGIDDCHADANCTNLPGLFSCACKSGFTGDGVLSCADVDECAANTDNCNVNASCTNTQGAFTCACNPGYSGGGVSCTDINECTANSDNCHATAICTNTPGAFSCACQAGYDGDGVTCTYQCPQPVPTGPLPRVHTLPIRCTTLTGLYTRYLTGDVAIAGNVVVVGMPSWLANDPITYRSSALVYRFDGTTWVFEQELVPPVPGADMLHYGDEVEISRSGQTIVVGSDRDAHVFRFDGTSWIGGEQLLPVFAAGAGTLLASVATTDQHTALAFYKGTVANGTGVVYVFDPATALETQRLADTRFALGNSGSSVSLDGDLMVVANRAAITVVYRFGMLWVEEQALAVGADVATDGTRIIVLDRGARTVDIYAKTTVWTEVASVPCGNQCELAIEGDRLVTGGDDSYATQWTGSLFLETGTAWAIEYSPTYEAYDVDISTRFAVITARGFADEGMQVVQFAP